MKQDNRTTRELAPDFIADMETPEGFKVTKLNDAEYMGERYGWSSNAKGWFRLSEHPEQPIKEAVICEHCGKDKKVITGLCPHCGKFPAIKEQSSNRGEGDILEYALSYIKKIDKETGTMWTEDDKTIASHFIEFSKTLAPELAKENQQLRESNTRLKERIEVLNQMERKFYMDICRAYNAGKQNALEMVAEGKRNGESLESFKSSHEYFIGEFPTFKTNVP